jgi:transcriptional regulator
VKKSVVIFLLEGYMSVTYLPKHFIMHGLNNKHDFIDKYSFGQLLIAKSGDVMVTYLPFLLNRQTTPYGSLQCHVAKANPIWGDITETPVTAIFTGPHAYISPNWYQNENQVPTWNYSAVFVEGRVTILTDKALMGLLSHLTQKEEDKTSDKIKWSTDMIPAKQYNQMTKSIVGLEIKIDNIIGKVKMSQNRCSEDRAGAVSGLLESKIANNLQVAKMIIDNNE